MKEKQNITRALPLNRQPMKDTNVNLRHLGDSSQDYYSIYMLQKEW